MTGQFRKGNVRASKLTPERVADIRAKYAAGWTQGRLARENQVSIGTIGRIVRGESWQAYQQVPMEEHVSAGQAAHVPSVPPISPEMAAAARESEARMAKLYGFDLDKQPFESNPGIVDRLMADAQTARDRDPGRKADQILSDLDKQEDE
jgi:hypothetical protein